MNTKLARKLAFNIEVRDFLADTLDGLESRLSDQSSDLDLVTFGRYSDALARLEKKITRLKKKIKAQRNQPFRIAN